MKLGRYDKYLGHMPYRLPILFACAECGGGIRVVCTPDGGYDVACLANSDHEGLASDTEHSWGILVADELVEKNKQLADIAKVLPGVANYIHAQRNATKRALFGED